MAGSLASQSTPERRSKSREGKTTFDWLLRHCFVHTQTQKSWAAENTNQNWNINGGIAWERRLISGRRFCLLSTFSTDGEKEMKKGRGPPDHRLGERALSLSSASASPSIPPPHFLCRSRCRATLHDLNAWNKLIPSRHASL